MADLTWFGWVWGLIGALLTAFIVVDAKNGYDNDPSTHTLSEYIKRWRRVSAVRSGILATGILSLVLVPAYLFCHLVLELI